MKKSKKVGVIIKDADPNINVNIDFDLDSLELVMIFNKLKPREKKSFLKAFRKEFNT